MKTKIVALLMLVAGILPAQTFSEKISRELVFEKTTTHNGLIIENINGAVTVSGYNGDKILVEIDKFVSAKTETRLEKAKKITLGVVDRADTLVLYVEGLCNAFGKSRNGNRKGSGYSYNANGDCESCMDQFDHKMTFRVKVPYNTNVSVSTINDGEVTIENVKGAVIARNINGGIKLQNLEREADASTINGNLDVVYVSNPQNACRFYSLNGDINAFFKQGLAANLTFESFNGSFYTNIAEIKELPVALEEDHSNKNGIRYKVNGNRYQVGRGGSLLDFETFNGNVYLKEQEN